MSDAIHYRIVPINPAAHLFEVSVTVPQPDRDGQRFTLPAWIPGSYLVRDFARNVVAASAHCGDGPVGLEKIDKSTWRAEACDAPLTLVLEIYAFDLSVRGAYLDTDYAAFNGPLVFPAATGQEARPCELEILAPPSGGGDDWQVATSMARSGAERFGFGSYAASDYWELIDHPVAMGKLAVGDFDVHGIPHAIAVYGEPRIDLDRICKDLRILCEAHHGLLNAPATLDRYLFLLTVVDNGYGGLEHRWSSTLMCSREDLPRRGDVTVSDGYRKFLGLCSHEYFHLWNVTRMKPAKFSPYRLGDESYTGLLWVFEGITSYYDDLALTRSGLISETSYLELLARTITRVLRSPGRERQSVEESSFDAWIKFYKQDLDSPNFIVSYYAKGALVACALDLTIRRGTAGRHSLDDVVRECWDRYGETGVGMPERGLETIAVEVCGLDLGSFFERHVRGTADVPLADLLADCGVSFNLRPATDSKDPGGKPADESFKPVPWLGAALNDASGRSLFGTVIAGSPAEEGGIAPGDEAVAVGGLKLDAGNLQARLASFEPGETVDLSVFRRERLLSLRVTLADPVADTCYLKIDEQADEAAASRRHDWLATRAPTKRVS